MSAHSLMAERVAEEVLATLGKGEKVNIEQIAIKHGYSQNTARAGLVQRTESFKAVIHNAGLKMEEIRDKALNALSKKNMNRERVPVILNTIDTLTKNARLLAGQSTENISLSAVLHDLDDD